MTDRKITVRGIRPNHPRRPDPSFVTLDLVLDYLKGQPVASVVLTERDITRLIEQGAVALRVLQEQREENS